MTYTKKTKKSRVRVESALAHIQSSFNNTLVTITTLDGDVLFRGSCGKLGFKGARKGTAYAASQVGSTLAKDMLGIGIKSIEMNFDGLGMGRDSVARAFQAAGISLTVLRDVTRIPHNGARAPKRRRV
jgi:small subunit ribosomal protein S11